MALLWLQFSLTAEDSSEPQAAPASGILAGAPATSPTRSLTVLYQHLDSACTASASRPPLHSEEADSRGDAGGDEAWQGAEEVKQSLGEVPSSLMDARRSDRAAWLEVRWLF